MNTRNKKIALFTVNSRNGADLNLAQRKALKSNVMAKLAAAKLSPIAIYGRNASCPNGLNLGHAVIQFLSEPAMPWAPRVTTLEKLARFCGLTVEQLISKDHAELIHRAPAGTMAAATSMDEVRKAFAGQQYFKIQIGRGRDVLTVEAEGGHARMTSTCGDVVECFTSDLHNIGLVLKDGTRISILEPLREPKQKPAKK